MAEFDFEAALQHATLASNLAAKWPATNYWRPDYLGTVLHASGREGAPPQKMTLLKAEELGSKAVEIATQVRTKIPKKMAHFRSELRLLLRKIEEAAEDAKSEKNQSTDVRGAP